MGLWALRFLGAVGGLVKGLIVFYFLFQIWWPMSIYVIFFKNFEGM